MEISRIVMIMALEFSFVACSPYHQVRSVAALPTKDHRVVIGRIDVVGSPVSDWVTGIYLGAELALTDKPPFNEKGIFTPNLLSGDDLSDGFSELGPTGGSLRTALPSDATYFIGLRVSSTVLLVNSFYVFPFLVRVPPKKGECEYIGTIRVQYDWNKQSVRSQVVDQWGRESGELAAEVDGCRPIKNLAIVLDNTGKEI